MINRRLFLTSCLSSFYVAAAMAGSRGNQKIDPVIYGKLAKHIIPGCAAGIVKNGRLAWANGYGWANIDEKTRMTPRTIMNIASVSKTVTATAVMQLWEADLIDLEDDVGRYLPFEIRNPNHPSRPISIRHLLNHRSSIRDGKAYPASYGCGDPGIALLDWIEGYFRPDGAFYDANENFHDWTPGTLEPPDSSQGYSNLGYGVLGAIVESVAGTPYSDYCQDNIFAPLGMKDTAWFLSDIDVARHAVPYGLTPEQAKKLGQPSTYQDILAAPDHPAARLSTEARMPLCLYGFPNYPDGLLRTSVEDLALFLASYTDVANSRTKSVLAEATVRLMLSEEHDGRALCWQSLVLDNGDLIWFHTGGDPGVNTFMGFRERDGAGVIVFFNGDATGDGRKAIVERLFAKSEEL